MSIAWGPFANVGNGIFESNGSKSAARNEFECDVGYVLADATAPGTSKKAGIETAIPSNGLRIFSPPDRKGLLDFMLESAFAMLLHHAPTQYPARAVRQWIPPSIPPELLTSGSRPVSRQSSSPVDPAEYPARAARQWIPSEQFAGGSRRVSRQSCSPVDPVQYPARAARRWIPPSIPPERLASGSRQVALRVSRQSGLPVPPQWIPPSIPPEQTASGSRQVSHRVSQSSSPVEWILPSIPPEQTASGSRQVSH